MTKRHNYITVLKKCACGGIGRRTGLRNQRETMGVRVSPGAPFLYAFVVELVDTPDSKSGSKEWGFESLQGHQLNWKGGRVVDGSSLEN